MFGIGLQTASDWGEKEHALVYRFRHLLWLFPLGKGLSGVV